MSAQEICQKVFETENCYEQMSILRHCDNETLVDVVMRFMDELSKAQRQLEQAKLT